MKNDNDKNVDFLVEKKGISNNQKKKKFSENRIELLTKLIKEGKTYTGVILNLNRYDRVLTSSTILFKKVSIMPKVTFQKLKESVCNIRIQGNDITNILPRCADSKVLLFIKLRRKLS